MTRRIVISLVLGVVLVVVQRLYGTDWPIALLSGVIGAVVAFLVLLVSDRWFNRVR